MSCFTLFFFFNATATTEIYTLSLHDALPIFNYRAVPTYRADGIGSFCRAAADASCGCRSGSAPARCVSGDRKSTRLNSSHSQISYAVFCLKKKKKKQNNKKHTKVKNILKNTT